jgi:hypothetical protein
MIEDLISVLLKLSNKYRYELSTKKLVFLHRIVRVYMKEQYVCSIVLQDTFLWLSNGMNTTKLDLADPKQI